MDDDKRATVQEMKQRFDENNAKLRNLESQKRTSEASLRRAAYTAAQLDEMPADVATYRSVGKAYFLQPKAALMEHLEGLLRGADGDLKRITATQEALVKTQEGLKAEITELITTLRAQ